MVFIKNYENNPDFNFKELHLSTDMKIIYVTLDDSKKFSIVEVYSAIKQWYLEDEKLLMFRFPMSMLDMYTSVLNDGWTIKVINDD